MDGEDSSRGPRKPGLQPRTLPSSDPRATSSRGGNSATSNESSPQTTSDSVTSAVSAISATTTPNSDASGPSPTSDPATPADVEPASPQAAPASPPASPAPQPAAPPSQPAAPALQPAGLPLQPAATATGPQKRAPPKPAKKLPSRFASWGRFMLPAHWLVSKPDDSASANDQLRTQPSRSTMHSESRPCTPAPPSPPQQPSESPGRAGQLTRRVSDWCHSRSKKGNLKRLRDDTDSDSPEESDDQSRRRGSEDQHTQAKVHKNALLRNPAAIHKFLESQDREVVQ